MPPVKLRGDGRKAKNPKKTLGRLLSYLKPFRLTLVVVVVCIVINAFATTQGNKAVGRLVDDYIIPMLGQTVPDFAPLVRYLTLLACVFAAGMVASFLNQWLMVQIGRAHV